MPTGKAEPLTKPAVGVVDTEGVILGVQKSETVGVVQVATAVVPAVVKLILVGQLAITGLTISGTHGFVAVTVTVKIQGVAILLAASRAVYVTVVTPSGKADPLTKPAVGVVDTEGVILGVQKSETVGVVQLAMAVVPDVVQEIFAGQFENIGATTSGTHGFPPVVYSITNAAAPSCVGKFS